MATKSILSRTGVKVVRGLRFRWAVADANPLWEVKSLIGKNTWECEVIDEPYTHNGKTYPGENAGLKRPFNADDIARSAAMSLMFEGLGNENDQFYANLRPGKIVHYDSGFGQFVRCEVTVRDSKTVLRPIALVGAWRNHDLFRRYRNGRVELGHYPEMIEKGETMTPHKSSIYEATQRGSDPTKLPALSYQAPEMTEAEAVAAKHWNVLEGLQAMLSEAKDPVETLKLAKSWLGAWEPK